MKRVGNLYARISDRENLQLAFWKAQRGKADRPAVVQFRGLSCLGYRIFPHDLRLTGRSRGRFRRRLNGYARALATGTWTQEEFAAHVQPLIAFTEHAQARGFRQKILFGCSPYGLESRQPWRQLGQHGQELPLGEPQQEHPRQPQPQPGLPRRACVRSSKDKTEVIV